MDYISVGDATYTYFKSKNICVCILENRKYNHILQVPLKPAMFDVCTTTEFN